MLLSELCDWSLVDERTLSEDLGGGGGGGGGGGEKETRVILESKVMHCARRLCRSRGVVVSFVSGRSFCACR